MLVNVAWGIGPGGVYMEGDAGSLEIRWRNGGTNPFEPVEWVEVRANAGRRRLDVESLELFPLVTAGIGGVIDDFVDAIRWPARPRAHPRGVRVGRAGTHRRGALDRSDPVFHRGVAAVAALPGPDWSPAVRQSLFANRPLP